MRYMSFIMYTFFVNLCFLVCYFIFNFVSLLIFLYEKYAPELTTLVAFRFVNRKYVYSLCLRCLLGSALRVLPAETRLTVYRRFEICDFGWNKIHRYGAKHFLFQQKEKIEKVKIKVSTATSFEIQYIL